MSDEAPLIIAPGDVKMTREALAMAQHLLNHDGQHTRADRLQHLIDECDRHRPLGSDGKHGNLHTSTCGCEDVEPQVKTTPCRCGHDHDGPHLF